MDESHSRDVESKVEYMNWLGHDITIDEYQETLTHYEQRVIGGSHISIVLGEFRTHRIRAIAYYHHMFEGCDCCTRIMDPDTFKELLKFAYETDGKRGLMLLGIQKVVNGPLKELYDEFAGIYMQ